MLVCDDDALCSVLDKSISDSDMMFFEIFIPKMFRPIKIKYANVSGSSSFTIVSSYL